MKTKESNKTFPSWKQLLFYVACVAAMGMLSCLTTQAADYARLYPHVSSSFEMIYEEPQPFFPSQSNFYSYNIRLTNVILMNLVAREYSRIQKAENWKRVSNEPKIELEAWMINCDKWCIQKFTGER